MQKIDLPDGLGLRMATRADSPFIATLFHSTREAFYLADQETDYIRNVIENQLELQTEGYGRQSPDAITFIIEKQGTGIGRLVLDFGKNIAHILDIALIKEARGRGYGKAVIQAVQYISQKQMLPVGLSVDRQNTKAKKLYLSLGFTVVECGETHEFLLWYPQGRKISSVG
jgi:ribosomal protein S18 acetylase RimI-like enzyme